MKAAPALGACKWNYILKHDSLQEGSEMQEGNCMSQLPLFADVKLFAEEAWKVYCDSLPAGETQYFWGKSLGSGEVASLMHISHRIAMCWSTGPQVALSWNLVPTTSW